ncbi:inositol monophosphatase family protein [Paramicrobacterium fandaimingii]|uniref:inositol monophosphatase family protein n=1 Tax=Paramicrobacterium fandaimingii TaxID=2708079 RepID=UPI0014215E29|nr:inositol monophosphatase family protein [Microbacterium fandaimingii]
MSDSESKELRKLAIEAAVSVRDDLLSVFRTPMRKDFKRDLHDIVTAHDQAAESAISSVLSRGCPDSAIIGEEQGKQGNGRVEWHVDPIDGTSNFSRGLPSWCVSIGAVIDQQTCAGVIYHPVSGDVFSADLMGAWHNDAPMVSSSAAEQIDATIVSSFPNAKDTGLFGQDAMSAQHRLIDDFQAVRNLGSGALNLAYVAAGWADATMGFQTNSWDICAGTFILEQAGGAFYGYRSGEAASPGYVASDYFAIGAGGDYPTLRTIIESYSARL